MTNKRTLLLDICPQLAKVGLPCFGYYNNKLADTGLSIHDHGSCYEICYLDKGMQPYYVHGENGKAELYRLKGGEVFVTRPHEKHSTGDFSQLRGAMYWVHFDADCKNLLAQTSEGQALLRTALETLNGRIIPIHHTIASRLTEAFNLLCTPDAEGIFRACQLLSLFICELSALSKKMNEHRIPSQLSPKTIEALSIVERHLTDTELSIQSIAERLRCSRSYLMTQFRRDMGITLHEYVLNKRIELARELLKTRSVTETAFILCFSSSQHFSRTFKERTDMTPREYVKSLSPN